MFTTTILMIMTLMTIVYYATDCDDNDGNDQEEGFVDYTDAVFCLSYSRY
jgi:hypothetical protein